jgi:uncharacterized Fe-S cluster protein YjdI/CDGSH-type Zn-finger protein
MSNERDPGTAPDLAAPSEPALGVDRGDRVHEFRDQGMSVTWSRRRCIHVGECVMHLPTVFEPGRRPWVDASQASPDAIARVVTRCPTGALHYARTDGGPPETVPATNSVLVTRNGPVYLRGDIELLDESGALRLADTRMALCRCGRSGNRPLCDGWPLFPDGRGPRSSPFGRQGRLVSVRELTEQTVLRPVPRAHGIPERVTVTPRKPIASFASHAV